MVKPVLAGGKSMNDLVAIISDNLYRRILKVGGSDQALDPQIGAFDVGDVQSLGLTLGSPGGG